jgi:hypothetical protein
MDYWWAELIYQKHYSKFHLNKWAIKFVRISKKLAFSCPTKQKYDYLVQDDLNPNYNPFKEE